MSNLDEKIKIHEERLKQLKAQKQDVLSREKKKSQNSKERTILDVKFFWVLICLK